MARGEFARIRDWLKPLASAPNAIRDLQSQLWVGSGDDACVVAPDQPLVMSVDMAVAGIHFPEAATAQQIASKSLRAALSDLAAMGARPWFYTMALQVPSTYPETWWRDFSKQLQQENALWGVQCLGGDLVAGAPLTLSVQVHGLSRSPLTRSGAQWGDTLWLTGKVGGAALGLQQILAGSTPSKALQAAFYEPPLPLAWMSHAASYLHAAIDISDGLLADLTHLLSASGVAADIVLDAVPILSEWQPRTIEDWVLPLTGGEDYQVLFTAPESSRQQLITSAEDFQQPLYAIGEIRPGSGYTLHWQGQTVNWPEHQQGYDHFDSAN